VTDTRQLVRMVGAAPVGETVPMEVLREGEMVSLSITLGRREEAEGALTPATTEPESPQVSEMLGLTLSEVTPELTEEFGLTATAGLVVTAVDPASDAAAKGLVPGDLITEAGQQAITSVADFEARIAETVEAGRKSLLLLIRRGGDPRFLALSVEQ